MRIFVPGRICLFGEHSDWAGGHRRANAAIEPGLTLIAGTDQGIHADVAPHPSSLVVTSAAPDGTRIGPREIPMDAAALLAEARGGGFFSYVAGVAYQALIHHHVRGLSIGNDRTDLPIRKGLSSSAAICVLAARAFNRLYDLKLTVRGEMELAYAGEITTPSRCGRMDQGCAFGHRAVLMEFDGDRMETSEVRVGGELRLVIVDLMAGKDTAEILHRLNRCYPFAEDDVERGVQELLGPLNRRIVSAAAEAVRAGDAARLGALMTEAQALFDRYAVPACPGELTAPVLHRVLAHQPLAPHVFGGKGVGSQGDGSAQFVARGETGQREAVGILRRDFGMPCLTLTLEPGPRVRKAVVPVAGLGTRLFPATKAVKKELLPVVDRDGVAKPAIAAIVAEAVASGIEEVVLVAGEADRAAFRSLFVDAVPPETLSRLPAAAREAERGLREIGRRVTVATQASPLGFGHAVLCAREAVSEEPFLLLLGDHLYRAEGDTPCARQLLAAFDRHGRSIVGLKRTPEADISRYGAVGGGWIEEGRLLEIGEFVEKPTVVVARERLRVPGIPPGEYLALFGLYVLAPSVFAVLEEAVARGRRDGGEYELTSALETMRQAGGFLGLTIEGESLDIGQPRSYLDALSRFAAP